MAPSRPSRVAPLRTSKLPKDPKEQFKRRATDLIRKVSNKDRYAIFLEPVDLEQIPGYADVITRPMDLSTVQKNLDMGVYRTPMEMRADLDLIWSNCCTFNADDSMYFREAVRLRALSARYYDDLIRLLTRDGVDSVLGIAPSARLQVPPSARTSAKRPPRHRDAHTEFSAGGTPSQRTGLSDGESNALAAATGNDLSTPSAGAFATALAGARLEKLRRARADYEAAVEAVTVARTEVAQTARKAGVAIPPEPSASTSAPTTTTDSVAHAPKTKSKVEQLFNGPAGLLQAQPDGRSIAQNAHRFTIAHNECVRDRCARVPQAWRRIGRWHSSGAPAPPFLSEERARDVRCGRQWTRWVERTAPVARRLLASVLDPSVVQNHDTAVVEAASSSAPMGENAAQQVKGGHINGLSEGVNMKMETGIPDSHIRVKDSPISTGGRKRSRTRRADEQSNTNDDPDSFLVELLGTERARKVARTTHTERRQEAPTATTPGKTAIGRTRALLKAKGIDTSFLNALVADSGTVHERHGSGGEVTRERTQASATDGRGVSSETDAMYQANLKSLLNANYGAMMNALRLRALRDTVNEAEREEVEDRERECVESVAKGVALAVSQLPPRLLVHPVDAAESALAMCNATQPSTARSNDG